jgi:hypothetical protein
MTRCGFQSLSSKKFTNVMSGFAVCAKSSRQPSAVARLTAISFYTRLIVEKRDGFKHPWG